MAHSYFSALFNAQYKNDVYSRRFPVVVAEGEEEDGENAVQEDNDDDDDAMDFDDSNINDEDERSAYGYRHPSPPFETIRHTSHDCTVPSSSGQYSRKVHLPIAVPHLIVIGAQKSGTSSLQAIFDRQQNVIKPSRKRPFEPHFFDWDLGLRGEVPNDDKTMNTQTRIKKRKKMPFNESSEGDLCDYRQSYSEFFNLDKIQPNVSVVFEKTPSYMIYPKIPQAIDAICTWKPKILAILRDPIDRAWSEHQMEQGRGKGKLNRAGNTGPKSREFADRINFEIQSFRRSGILGTVYNMMH